MTNALFVGVFLWVAVVAARHPRRANLDAALFFGALAFVVAQGPLFELLGLERPAWLRTLSLGLVVALPYLLLRLVEDLVDVPRRVRAGTLAGLAAAVIAMLALAPELPPTVVLPIALYFLLVGGYVAYAFVRGARLAGGVTRRRMRAGAVGTGLLALAVFAAGAAAFLPPAGALTQPLAFGSAVAYLAAFAPPGFLRRAWQQPELRRFLNRAGALATHAGREQILASLEAAAAEALGSTTASIALWDDGAGLLRPRTGEPFQPGEAASGRAFAEQRPVAILDLHRDGSALAARMLEQGITAAMAAPMSLNGRRVGVLAVRARKPSIFADEDLELVALLARQAALVLEGVQAYEELQRANARLGAQLAAVEDLNRQLSEATRAKSEFLAGMSHELRTPLNAILGFTDLLAEQLDPQLTQGQRRYLGNVRAAGGHLLALINDVLDLSKVEAGRMELRPETMAVSTLLEPVLASAREMAWERGLAFSEEHPDDDVVHVDAGRIRQVLYNLLSNAVKFTQAGGVSLEVAVRDGALSVDVTDTGIGIAAADRGRVFGAFERLHEGRSEATGTGLGLALSKRIVELHGGTIGFESEEGRGTRFSAWLPGVAVRPVSGERLLVVEDERSDADLIVALASAARLRSEVVSTAAAAIDAIRRAVPVGVVLDLRLPDARGETVLAALQASPETRRVPVIVVTVEDDEGRSRPLGAQDHLTKPLDVRRLADWLAALAAEREALDATASG